MTEYITKDSGEREEYDSGMKRDTESGKPRFDLMVPEGVPFEEQMLTRFAMLLSRGADKYDARNWEMGNSEKELARAKSSAFRHFFQWFCGQRDEDHAAAVMFNLMVVETIELKMREEDFEELAQNIFGSDGPEPVLTECPHDHLHTLDCPHVTLDQLREQKKALEAMPQRFIPGADQLQIVGSQFFQHGSTEAADAATIAQGVRGYTPPLLTM